MKYIKLFEEFAKGYEFFINNIDGNEYATTAIKSSKEIKSLEFIQNNVLVKLDEFISAREAYRDRSAIQTVIDGKRDVGFITIIGSADVNKDEFWDLIKTHDLGAIKLPKNPFNAYIYYRKSAKRNAKELEKIANKYGGYLSYEATKEETRRIGELLGYNKKDIDEYISKKYK